MTPRWRRITEMVEARPDIFEIQEMSNGFRTVIRKENPELVNQVCKTLRIMLPGKAFNILDIDPIQSISPMLRSLWAGRGFEVADVGVIVVQFPGSDKIYQYPFIKI